MKRSKKIPTKTKELIKQITPTEFAVQHEQKKPKQTPFLLLMGCPCVPHGITAKGFYRE